MKKYLIITLVLTIQTAFCQDKELYALYDFSIMRPDNGVQQIEVISDGYNVLNKIIGYDKKYKVVNKEVFESKKTFEYYIFQDLSNREIIYQEKAFGTIKNIKDSLSHFDWTITGETKMILNYKCSQAKTTYKGRDYIAYFTLDIPFKVSPWKFNGLPGVTLLIRSKYDFLRIELIEMKIRPLQKPLNNPIPKKELISWTSFEKWYLKVVNRMEAKHNLKYSKNPKFGGKIYIPNVEIISELNLTQDLKKELLQSKTN